MLLDGAIGSLLQRLEVPMDNTAWAAIALESHPDTVRHMHSQYLHCGVDIITTNTFSSARHNLEPIGLGDKTWELNYRAVNLALEARDRHATGRDVAIAGSISHFGILVEGEPGLALHRHARPKTRNEITESQARMREALRPGITENYLWSILAQTNIELGGEWLECHLLASGGRTNPWYQEASDKLIRSGDLVAFDTDMVGPYGYCADVSRTFHCGPSKPTSRQKQIYRLAYEQVQHNLELIKPGVSFRELSDKSWRGPPEFEDNRYVCMVHGVGLVDEYPDIAHPLDWETHGYDGVIEENMVLCVESYIGQTGDSEGLKLEEQVVVTADGIQSLSTFPFEDDLLN